MVLIRIALIALALAVSGCTLFAAAPTVQHCDKVEYERDGDKIKVRMTCRVPPKSSVEIPGVPGL